MFRRNTEKYITFTVPTEKEVPRICENAEEITKKIPDILQFLEPHNFYAQMFKVIH